MKKAQATGQAKRPKQTNISNFFQKKKEPELWNTVQNDNEHRTPLLKNVKVEKKKPSAILSKTPKSKKEATENVIFESPAQAPKRKSLLSKKSKSNSSVKSGSSSGCRDVASENENGNKAIETIVIDEDQSIEESFTNVKRYNNREKEARVGEHKEKKSSYLFKSNTDSISNCKQGDKSSLLKENPEFTKRPMLGASVGKSKTDKSREIAVSNGHKKAAECFSKPSPRSSSFESNDCKLDTTCKKKTESVPPQSNSSHPSDLPCSRNHSVVLPQQKRLKLKLSNGRKKRSFEEGNSGFLPMKKKHAFYDEDDVDENFLERTSSTPIRDTVSAHFNSENDSNVLEQTCEIIDARSPIPECVPKTACSETMQTSRDQAKGAEFSNVNKTQKTAVNSEKNDEKTSYDMPIARNVNTKLNSSLKLSKTSSKKLRFTSIGANTITKDKAYTSKTIKTDKYHDTDDPSEEDILSTYGFERKNDQIIPGSGISKKEVNMEVEQCSSTNMDKHREERALQLDDDYDLNGVMDTSKDSFTELIADVDIVTADVHKKATNTKEKEQPSMEYVQLDDSLFNVAIDEEFKMASTGSKSSGNPVATAKCFTMKTFLVLEVLRQEGQNGNNLSQPEKVLRLFDEETSEEAICILREDWEMMKVMPGDSVHITDFSLQAGSTTILDNNSEQYLVLYPDTLVSGTTISMGITCQRRAVLSELFKTDGPNEAMFLGTFLHELFDFLIQEKHCSSKSLQQKSVQMVSQYGNLNTLYSIGIDQQGFIEKVRELTTGMSLWAQKFLKPHPDPSSEVIDFKRGSEAVSNSNTRLSISDVVDIEENIICPSLGLKGKIDASVNVKIHRERKTNSFRKELESYLLPFELKTGKMFSKLGSIEHRAQVILYTLMMSEKHATNIDAGLLYYLKTGHLQGVPATHREKRSLIIKRNELARYLSKENQRNNLSMPGLLKNERACKRCPIVNTCMIFHKAVEKGSRDTSGIGATFEDVTGHLTKNALSYFVKWFQLIMLEAHEEYLSNGQKKLWSKTSEEREANGKSFGKMVIKAESLQDDGNHWMYVFSKGNSEKYKTNNSSIMKGDRVIISEEFCKTFGVSTGYIQNISPEEVYVLCSQRIRPRNDVHKSLFRIEKDESLSSQKIPLGNLMKLLLSCNDHDAKIRNLIIELAAPKFSVVQSNHLLKSTRTEMPSNSEMLTYQKGGQQYLISESDVKSINSVYESLNPDQQKAVKRCLAAEDYVMVLGMPGTGKTTTIACIVKILVSLGKSVLIASYTHSAVDNILLKLKEMKLDFLRLGQARSVHEEIKPYIADQVANDIQNTDELHCFYKTKNIIATTCLGINHPLFMKKRFDYCIVDEASQITQPVCFGVIRHADVFVLVGDHYQLPPLVQSVEARNSGMDVSLFKLLSEKHPSAIVSLRFQYRMHQDIMALANELIYGHRMQCGNEKTAKGRLKLPNYDHFKEDCASADRIVSTDVLNPNQTVVFINTDSVPCLETISGNHIQNESEAVIVSRILHGLLQCGLEPSDIGIISPLRHQLKTIRESLGNFIGYDVIANIEINTVDKYQGRDKSCIIVSFVRSNAGKNVGELLKDWRRLNVALTRAKHKLIMVGSKDTLSSSPVLGKLVEFVEELNGIVMAPKGLLS